MKRMNIQTIAFAFLLATLFILYCRANSRANSAEEREKIYNENYDKMQAAWKTGLLVIDRQRDIIDGYKFSQVIGGIPPHDPFGTDLGQRTVIPSGPWPVGQSFIKQVDCDLTIADENQTPPENYGYMIEFVGDTENRRLSFPCSFSRLHDQYITEMILPARVRTSIIRKYSEGRWWIYADPASFIVTVTGHGPLSEGHATEPHKPGDELPTEDGK